MTVTPRIRQSMASLPGPLGEQRIASASKGASLTTTAALVVFPNGTTRVQLIPRNFSTAVVARYAVNPYVAVLRTDNNLKDATDYSDNAQDATAATVVTLSGLLTAALGGYLYVGAHVPFRGVSVTMTANVNGTASVLSGYYWNGTAWADASVTDGTDNAGATFGQTGNITWTVPTAWAKTSLLGIDSPTPGSDVAYYNRPLYWMRFQVSAALDTTTTASQIVSLNRSTSYAELPETLAQEFEVTKAVGGESCIEALTDAGTGNLIVNCYTGPAEVFS